MIRQLILTILIFVAYSTRGYSQNESLQELIDIALQVSPELKIYEAKIRAAENRIQQNTNLPDPMISLGIMSLPTPSFSFNKEMMTAKIIGFSQEFPFPGTLNSKRKVNSKSVEIIEQEYNEKRNEIIKDLTKSYYELIYIRKEIELTEKSKQLMKQISDVVGSMYSVANASQQNVFRVDLEITKLSEKIAELKSEENNQLSVINSFLLRDPSAELVTDSLPEIIFKQITVDELLSVAETNSPLLKGIKLAEEREKFNQVVAENDFYPMFKLSLQYALRDKVEGVPLDNMLSIMLDISLPFNYGGKVTAMVEETKSMQEMYRKQYSASIQMLKREIGILISKLKSLKERIELVEQASFIQAKENLSSALASYQVGKIDFMNVIEAQNNLYTIEKNLYRLKADYLKQFAELEFLVGTKIK